MNQNHNRCIHWLLWAVFTVSGCSRDSNDEPTSEVVGSSATLTEPPAGVVPEQLVFDSEKELDRAAQLAKKGDFKAASQALQRVLLSDPTNVEILFRLARIYQQQGELEAAIELLDSISPDDPIAGLPALGQSADWCMDTERYAEAEDRYRQVLSRVPDAAVAHRQLAFLLNRQGRRHEAVVHLQQLCRLGDIRQDELHALLVIGHAIFEDPNNADPSDTGRHYWPIGPVAEARMLYTANRYTDAVELLDEIVSREDVLPSVMAFYGLLAIESQDDSRFRWWLSRCDEEVKRYAEYWSAIGVSLIGEQKYEQAVHALLRAMDLDPTDLSSMRRINQSLQALGRDQEAERWVNRYVTQRNATLASNEIGGSTEMDPEDFETVAKNLEQLGRPLEAVTWRLFGSFYQNPSSSALEELKQKRKTLASADNAFPSQSIRLEQLQLDAFAEPMLAKSEIPATPFPRTVERKEQRFDKPKFENIAGTLGIGHTYWVSSQPQSFRFALYQSLGGGVAVLDFDLDGETDFYLAQGGAEPPSMIASVSNLFFRQVDGRVNEITSLTDTKEFLYTVGVTAGDWNQDGFQDIVLANIGSKVLLINNGDGTFRREEFDLDPDHGDLISSVAMGDLDGDAIPDLISLYYVEDPAMLQRPELNENGDVLTVSPASFKPGLDRLTMNDGKGGYQTRKISESASDASTGLGVVIADWNNKPGNEIFIGNDIRANHLWIDPMGNGKWSEIAALSGCAHGNGGIATASMGIAVADYDQSGTLDIHIANFYQEPVSFFMNRGGSFEDRAIQFKLHEPSLAVLGFGCQALDYNNDGRSDIAVTNGNIEKAPGEPLEQSPQLFANAGDQFQLLDVQEPSNYWQGKYLGRGMARLDFNRDGQMDLMITHLGAPTAVLLNQTNSVNNWLQVQLVGTKSERDAIGAKVTVNIAGKDQVEWLVGGDGYLCRNDPILHFGLGEAATVDKIQVSWPSGVTESFGVVEVNQRLMLIEGFGEQGPYRQ
jgi:tetratricopeptide (TPR) repeat protein